MERFQQMGHPNRRRSEKGGEARLEYNNRIEIVQTATSL